MRSSPPRQPSPARLRAVFPFLALLAIAAGGIGAIAVVDRPQTTRLQSEVDALQAQIGSEQAQLQSARAQLAGLGVPALRRALLGLQRRVHGLSSAGVPTATELQLLWTCAPELQQEIEGLGVQIGYSGRAIIDSVSLTRLRGLISPDCRAALG